MEEDHNKKTISEKSEPEPIKLSNRQSWQEAGTSTCIQKTLYGQAALINHKFLEQFAVSCSSLLINTTLQSTAGAVSNILQ